ncbi:MAG: 1-acyl-sn-glycerol-3-phosphate acyltransferase [Alphaproteobacteria bacterium]|nr:1-acyl-sn-glycerol-3-phosphate acyltransferase [Alphaproteobacteria bacterium]
MILARSLLYVIWIYLGMAAIATLYAPWTLFSRKGAMAAMRAWSRLAQAGLPIVGIRIKIEGLENIPDGPTLVAMKHQSMFDVTIPPLTLRDPCIVYKNELSSTPFMGFYLKHARMIPVARETQATALKRMLRAARTEADEGREIFIFPEGTRVRPGAPPQYKPGVAALYRELNRACVPIATNSGLCWPAKGVLRRPGVITVQILPPIAPGLPRADFMRELEGRIETASNALLPAAHAPAPALEPAQT